MIVEKKQVPDPEIIMKNYVIAYEQGLGSLDPEDKENIIWFTCEVMPAVEKIGSHIMPPKSSHIFIVSLHRMKLLVCFF